MGCGQLRSLLSVNTPVAGHGSRVPACHPPLLPVCCTGRGGLQRAQAGGPFNTAGRIAVATSCCTMAEAAGLRVALLPSCVLHCCQAWHDSQNLVRPARLRVALTVQAETSGMTSRNLVKPAVFPPGRPTRDQAACSEGQGLPGCASSIPHQARPARPPSHTQPTLCDRSCVCRPVAGRGGLRCGFNGLPRASQGHMQAGSHVTFATAAACGMAAGIPHISYPTGKLPRRLLMGRFCTQRAERYLC